MGILTPPPLKQFCNLFIVSKEKQKSLESLSSIEKVEVNTISLHNYSITIFSKFNTNQQVYTIIAL